MSIFYANLFFPIDPPCMISAESYKLFELEILHRVVCKSLVEKRALISCIHPSILGGGGCCFRSLYKHENSFLVS